MRSIGSPTAEAAAIVRDNGFGRATNDPGESRALLLECLTAKQASGRVPDTASSAGTEFERETQFRKVDEVIENVLARR